MTHKSTFFIKRVLFCCFLWPQKIPITAHMSEENIEIQSGADIKLRLPAEFKSEIETAAKAMHISVSAMTRLALAEYIRLHFRPATEEVGA